MSKLKELADKVTELTLEINKKKVELSKLKNELITEMASNRIKKIEGKEGLIKLTEYRSKYSAFLKKEFKDLSPDKKREFYKTGLLKLTFRLDVKKFEEFKKNNSNKNLESFIQEKKNFYSISVKLNKDSIEKLQNDSSDILEITPEVKEILDDFEEERYYLGEEEEDEESFEEIDYNERGYLSHFMDDDPSDEDIRKREDLD